MKKITVGVVGAGIYGNYHIHTFICDPNVERVVFCDLNEERRCATSKKYNVTGYATVKEMIHAEKLDAVSIATPDPYHFEPAKDAIEAGIKYLLIEKPLATTIEECEEILRLAERHNVKISVDFHKRWDPAYNCIKDEIQKDKEKVIRGYMALDDIIDVPKKWFTWTDKSSPAWFLGVHCYDLIRYITGSEVEKVYASGNKEILEKEGYHTWDNIQTILTMKDGSNWTVETSWILPNTYPKSNDGQLVILTENKYFKNESYRGVKYFTEKKENIPNYIFMNFDEHSASGFGLEPMQEFISDIINEREFRTSAYDGLQATRIAQAVHESAETGKVVYL
ncbi:Gfo/Idh/MocA family protein [Amedibacillus dolichus]|uniref:Oxidoreductase, NAD-binding domain protein n=1 Tax=Amedibacillus dolichus DSM 3991 TaxID=428127 RepID=A8RAP7_9FIRM|nr:Gfo/Idh/MocA family oxidoreductase [Amedibacillus dolichus]EDP11695.1 oxidoreductase, NAD-binding domain protein [Amedibacillus dolichus DSM 3991]